MNITLPPINTPLATILSEKMLNTHQAFSLLKPLMFDVNQIEVLHTIKSILKEAAQKNQKVFIAGDYDADGICSTAMMVTLCRQLNIQVGYYIPHRVDEGYGLKPPIAKQALDKDYDVFICVDNGVSAFEALELLKQTQKRVIIIDHHTMSQPIHVDALLHPQLLDEEYHFMCTSGLVWLLASFLNLESDFMIQCAGTATIADMMPLHQVNRYLVVKAIDSMNNKAIITPFALLIKKQSVNEEDLSFQLIPKINAIGRMSELANANTMVNYLTSTDLSSMVRYAASVEDINEQRKVLTKSMSTQALAQAQGDDHFKFIVSDEFHEGIVGLIANQLMRQVNTNVFVGVKKANSIKGSMRSHNVHLVELIQPYEHLLMHFGGHAKAAGLEIALEHFETFKAHILEDMKDHPPLMQVEEGILVDPSLITLESVLEFESLRPFGMGWEKPTIKLENVRIKSITPLKGGLSKATLFTSANTIDVFAFDPAFAQCVVNQCLDIEGTLGINTYLGSKSVQITLSAFKPCQDDTI
jgi:single-stranded-DNA-specific exonuclease